ncbi:Biotin carboxyl carrier protein [Candidatus Accumulibacter phosphatis]|uniref:Biotin carboxyl carrier protein n=1 Tax=Candidatus Accumulibacter phosphatis TaxID=327160 RepID=A0A5S4F9K6_9PROT|nr:Biotin carboxyl carrier protein [Candidatus Accumulibacter phosphatis]
MAGMGGVVVEVNVKVGQTVAAGDRLLVLEAMKMKTPVISTRAGQVTRVLVAPGDAVEGGQPLVTIA